MDRRAFLRTAGTTALAGLTPELAAALADVARLGPDRPNVLFCISDDQSWCYTSRAGDPVVRTPAFDRVAAEGVYCPHCFTAAPTCTASRGTLLTGQFMGRLDEGANLWSTLPLRFQTFPDLLEAAGYRVGLTRKGWGPGDARVAGRTRNPAGPSFKGFAEFLDQQQPGQPFCFWFGSNDPHRPYEAGSGVGAGLDPRRVAVPRHLPDCDVTRGDLCDYFHEIQRFDTEVGAMLDLLRERGLERNTIVVVTGDNGLPFPRSKANLYDWGTRVPLAVRWPAGIPAGREVTDFVSFQDFAPTFLEAAGLPVPPTMTGRTLLPLLATRRSGRVDPTRDRVHVGRERHANVRAGNLGYPARGLRTDRYLYVRNYAPDRWPAGDPEGFGDIDGGPTKTWLLQHRTDPAVAPLFELACGQRGAEELYDLASDPAQVVNVADRAAYQNDLARLRGELEAFLRRVGDPRASGLARFDSYPYYGGRPARPQQ